MPECNPCVVCGKKPGIVLGPDANPKARWQQFCYENPYDHSTMVTGRTREECVELWNRLNPLPFQTVDIKVKFPALLRMLFRRPARG